MSIRAELVIARLNCISMYSWNVSYNIGAQPRNCEAVCTLVEQIIPCVGQSSI